MLSRGFSAYIELSIFFTCFYITTKRERSHYQLCSPMQLLVTPKRERSHYQLCSPMQFIVTLKRERSQYLNTNCAVRCNPMQSDSPMQLLVTPRLQPYNASTWHPK